MTNRGIYIENNFLNEDECRQIIQNCKESLSPGTVGAVNAVNEELRRSNVMMITNSLQEADLFHKINKKVWEVNQKHFFYDVRKLNFLQFTEYSEKYSGKYDVHVDLWNGVDSAGEECSRKLSLTIQLSEPSEYEGGELCFPDNDMYNSEAVKGRGTLVMFSSFDPHGVTPVTRGDRYSLVGWALGPHWR